MLRGRSMAAEHTEVVRDDARRKADLAGGPLVPSDARGVEPLGHERNRRGTGRHRRVGGRHVTLCDEETEQLEVLGIQRPARRQ